MLTSFDFKIGKNKRGQWVARHEETGHMALLDKEQGLVVKPGCDPSPELLAAFVWMLGTASACDDCTDKEGCSPFKA